MNGRPWTDAELRVVREHHGKVSARETAALLGRTLCGVHGARNRLGLGCGTRTLHDRHFAGFLTRHHRLGWSDNEIAEAYSRKIAKHVDRHTVGRWRAKLGLPPNTLSEHRRQRVRAKTTQQLREAGLPSLAALRLKVFRERAAQAGWPSDLRPRSVQILNALWDHGPMTRRELADRIGMPWKGSRMSLRSNDQEGSYLAHLMARGLVICLGRVHRVAGQGRGRSTCVYSLPLTIERTSHATPPS